MGEAQVIWGPGERTCGAWSKSGPPTRTRARPSRPKWCKDWGRSVDPAPRRRVGPHQEPLGRARNLYSNDIDVVILPMPQGRGIVPQQPEREVTVAKYLRLLAHVG